MSSERPAPDPETALVVSEAAHHRLAERDDLEMFGAERIVMVAYPGFTALDLVGPQYFFASLMGATVAIAAAASAGTAVSSDTGVSVLTTDDLATIDGCDVLFVPGSGGGLAAAAHDESLLGHLRRLAAGASLVTSVCTGSVLLGAAGLLDGRRATSHWVMRPYLHLFGATAVDERVVVDGPIVTAAGVTAGIDLGLHVTEALRGPGYAAALALQGEIETPLREPHSRLVVDVEEMFAPMVAATLAGSMSE